MTRTLFPILMIQYGQFVLRPMIDSGVDPWVVGTVFAAPLVGFLVGCVREPQLLNTKDQP
ncbi:membrane protein [Mycobacterium phage Plumbus]|uniref:Uncharacterized protein n=8 Tax=Caudoviricetes TaxID=2731619 RepID=A0A385DQ34_9CAUD|nr:gp95 [Mycobacterium phage Ramsey]YP_009636247.1 hypothetical protein FGG20_gp076 [Mycobacterium phage Baka]YP_009956543.1 hypothetical protein I5H32_gp092 [Mycobacterium phage EleanorGeorge]YP_009956757.1 hypothetical protein I5H34_gp089 [Mycobacterium phage Empress]YP_009961391.1 hypothetical protein I5H79_gp093 [Mycobacterium phage Poenanya]YP_009961499.1 hypothetical protein I5H80_gp094 [Mycobacterium phage Polka14]YP_010113874.1 membrane protein [Mycobacterium phage Plumbus]ASJ79679.1